MFLQFCLYQLLEIAGPVRTLKHTAVMIMFHFSFSVNVELKTHLHLMPKKCLVKKCPHF